VDAMLANHPRTHTRCSTPCTFQGRRSPRVSVVAQAMQDAPGREEEGVGRASSARNRRRRRHRRGVTGRAPAADICERWRRVNVGGTIQRWRRSGKGSGRCATSRGTRGDGRIRRGRTDDITIVDEQWWPELGAEVLGDDWKHPRPNFLHR
jgi:hypothetical protein